MDILIIILVAAVLFFNVYLFFKLQKNSNKEDFTELSKIKDDITGLKVSLNESDNRIDDEVIFSNMSKEVAKDMTGTLSRVDEKVASYFNKQVEDIQNSQSNFSRILAGVKQYGGLSEFSLANLLQDLLPSSQYIANAKMKPDETRDLVEFAVKLQNDVLCPIDSENNVKFLVKLDLKDSIGRLKNIRQLMKLFKIKIKKHYHLLETNWLLRLG